MNYDLRTLRGDIFGGVTSTVVALPVALAFGIASGLGPAAGLYGAIAVGFFASSFGGSGREYAGQCSGDCRRDSWGLTFAGDAVPIGDRLEPFYTTELEPPA